MDPTPPPPVENELLSSLYSDEEKAQILGQIEQVAISNRITVDTEAFRPLKRGIMFPVVVNLLAIVLVVGAWFGASAYFQTREEGLKLKTDQMFSTESKLLAKVLEDSKNQLAAKNAEIDKIKGDLDRVNAEKADLQKSFDDRIAAREAELRVELNNALAAEKKRLQDSGLSAPEVAEKLKEFEIQKEAEFSKRLESYRRAVQAEIDERTLAVSSLQAKLQSTVSQQEALRQEIEKQTKARENDLKNQLSSQAANLDQLQRDKDDLDAFYRDLDGAMAGVRKAFEAGDWAQAETEVSSLRQVLAKGVASTNEAVRRRAQAQAGVAAALDTAVTDLSESATKTQAKKDQALALAEARWKQAQADADALKANLESLTNELAEAKAQLKASTAETEALKHQMSDLQATVEELTPYRTREQQLTQLFEAPYPTAKDRFVATLGSEPGHLLFPQFDEAWRTLQREGQSGNTSEASRQRALDDVLQFTSYLQGTAIDPQATRESTERLARTDGTYRHVVDSIQALATAGAVEAKVSTATTQLYGTVAAVAGAKVTLEPLTKVRPQKGQLVELRRVDGKNQTVLGRGIVLTASDQKVELDWTGNPVPPLSGDPAYVVLP